MPRLFASLSTFVISISGSFTSLSTCAPAISMPVPRSALLSVSASTMFVSMPGLSTLLSAFVVFIPISESTF